MKSENVKKKKRYVGFVHFVKMADVKLDNDSETFNMSKASSSLASDSSSLVDLKAEVFRKQQEAQYNKIHGRNKAAAESNSDKKNNIWSKKNAGILRRTAKDDEEQAQERRRIQTALEQKARIYEKLKKGDVKDEDDRFLVDFDRRKRRDRDSSDEDERLKPEDIPEASNAGEEFVEYVDALGRSRMCMRKELDAMKSQDKQSFGETGSIMDERSQTMLSEDMRREFLRQKWEAEEEENLRKTQIHYKDVLFDEARTHGASFYNFSRNEKDRADELNNLNSLHKETERERSRKDSAKAKREAALKARLKKVRDRKRLKMGLPILEDDDDETDGTEVSDVNQTEEKKEKSIEESVMDGIKILRQAEEERARKNIVREWDIGKEGVSAKEATDQDKFRELYKKAPVEKKVLSQQEWVDQKRVERKNEFAPPSSYEPARKSFKKSNDNAKIKNTNSTSHASTGLYAKLYPDSPRAKSAMASAPSSTTPSTPSNYQNVPPPGFVKEPFARSNDFDSEEPLPPGVDLSRPPPGYEAKPPTSNLEQISLPNENQSQKRPQGSVGVSLEDRLKMHEEVFKPKPIHNEVGYNRNPYVGPGVQEASDSESSEESDSDDDNPIGPRPPPASGAEIAPPSNMDYYSNTKSRTSRSSGFRSHEAMAESFLCGLKNNLKPGSNADPEDNDDSD